jgi:methionine-rich copper-binding protein CopC
MRFPSFVALAAATSLAFSPGLAIAHTSLVASTPAANATVARPAQITMTFNERLLGPTVRVTLAMTGMPAGMSHDGAMAGMAGMDHSKMGGTSMASHAPMPVAATSQLGRDGKSVTLTPRRALSAGTYRVDWVAAGTDSHRMIGSFSFTVR